MNDTSAPKHQPRPSRVAALSLLMLSSLVGAAAPAAAQTDDEAIAAAIDEIFRWATPSSPGAVVAVHKDGELIVHRAYGMANLEEDIPMKTETVFDVGSVTKQFVAAAVLVLVEDDLLALDGDIREHIPQLPDYGYVITVDHLLTHTSGIRDWTGLRGMSSGFDDEDALTMILRQRGLNFAPGDEWSYSNSGYVLLKELVKRVTGESFAVVARERLFEPLGMGSTTYTDNLLGDHADLARAYRRAGAGWEPDMLIGNERGGGGALLSTASDLLVWNEALSEARLGAFVTQKLHEPARLNNGRRLGYARGLILDDFDGARVIWHSGSAAGYKTMLSRFPEGGLSLAILCNGGNSTAPGRYAIPIRELFVPPDESLNAADEAAVVGFEAAGKDGLYFGEEDAEPLRLIARGGQLQVVRGPVLVPVAEDRVRSQEGEMTFRSGEQFELQFLSPDAFKLRPREGQATIYRRAQPPELTAADMQAFVGRYGSDDLQAVIELSCEADVIRASLNGDEPLVLKPADPDTFELGPMILRFRRNADGHVVTLDFSNPILRHVLFSRLGDGR